MRTSQWRSASRALFVALFVPLFALAASVGRADAQQLVPQLTTNKGCQESGDNPVFAVGERLTISFRIGSSSLAQAKASLVDYAPNDRVTVFSFGQVATNRTYNFAARIGGSMGREQLVLRAEATGATTQRDTCTFTVSDGPPPATRTRTVARTPTPTRTPGNPTATRTPGEDLSGVVRTNRGCREDGDSAIFAVDDRIIINLRLDSDTRSQANASLLVTRPNGVQTVISFGSLPTNVPLSFAGTVGPPNGVHELRLRAGTRTLDICSFLVGGSAPPTATRSATRTRTPSRTATRPPTATVTPIPAVCVGACTMTNIVSVNDLLTVIEIAAGRRPLSDCPSANPNGDQQVSLDEVLQAVTNALEGCPIKSF